MSRSGATDFTVGSIPKHLINFSIPMLLGNALQALYNTVDTFWVGRYLGSGALAAVSVSFPIIFILISLVIGITMATTVLVSQYYGAKNEAMVKRVIGNSITMLSVGAVIITVLGIALRTPILRLMNTPPELIKDASGYLVIILAGIIFTVGYNVFGAILRGLGDSKTPLLFLVYSTVTNIILDPLMILGVGPFPRMGINGAALATVIAQAVSVVLAIRHLNRNHHLVKIDRETFGFDGHLVGQTFKIGLPSGIQQMLISFGAAAVMSIINRFGTVAVAAYGVGARFDQFANMPAMSVGLAVSALVGQNLGAGRDDRVKEIVRTGVLLAGAVALTAAAIFLIIPAPLVRLFNNEPLVVEAGVRYLRIMALSYVPFAAMFVVTGVMRGAGDTIPPMIVSLLSLWLVRVPLASFLSQRMQVSGVWTAIVISSLIGLSLATGYYFTGRWKKAAVVHGQAAEALELVGED